MDETLLVEGRSIWFSDVFVETAQLSSFLNFLHVRPNQISHIDLSLAGPNTWRILLVCMLTEEQDDLRSQWEQVEAALRSRRQELPTGGGH